MADTVVETLGSGTLTLTFTGAGADWDSKTNFSSGLKVKAIKLFPSAANDILAIRNGSSSGPILTKMKDTTGGGGIDSGFGDGTWIFPYLLVSDCTFNTIANVIVMFILA